MRYFYVILCGLGGWLSKPAQAQAPADTTQLAADPASYSESVDQRRVSSQADSAGTCLEVLHWQEAAGVVRVYYPSGRLKEYIPYADMAAGRRHGVATAWYEGGQLRTSQSYWQGQRTGTLLLYYETGALKRKTEYLAGSEQLGTCYDPQGRPVAYFPYEQLPLYPGGPAQLTREITKGLRLARKLPAEAYWGPLQVEVMLQIAEDGSIQAPRVTRSSRLAAYDQAVLAAIAKLSRRFSPGRRDGQLVACAYYLPVQMNFSTSYQLQRGQ